MPCHAMPCPAPALTWTDAVGARGYPWVPGELPDAAALLGHRLLYAVDELKVAVEVLTLEAGRPAPEVASTGCCRCHSNDARRCVVDNWHRHRDR